MSQDEKVTVLIITGNEGAKIRECLESVKWADEIFVVLDHRSHDATESIAKGYTDRVVRHDFTDTGAQRNWAIPQAAHRWVLVVDSDERVTEPLQKRIRGLLSSDGKKAGGYEIRRRSYFFDRMIDHCGWGNEYVLRLFRRDEGRYDGRQVHAKVAVPGQVERIEEPIIHHTYSDFDEYFRQFQRFTTWSAEDLRKRGKKPSWTNLCLRPLFRFWKMYFLKRGFMEGKHGLILCTLASFQVFTRYAKLWWLERRDSAGTDSDETRNHNP